MEIVFPSVNPFAISDNLSVRINRINGLPVATAAAQKRISILTASEFSRIPGTNTLRGMRAGTANSTLAFLGYARHNDISTRWQITNPYRNVITVINHGVTTISQDVFGNSQLSRVSIPNTVTRIDFSAFGNNPLINVSIGANIQLNNSFPYSFDNFYYNNGRLAGTYTYDSGSSTWSFSP